MVSTQAVRHRRSPEPTQDLRHLLLAVAESPEGRHDAVVPNDPSFGALPWVVRAETDGVAPQAGEEDASADAIGVTEGVIVKPQPIGAEPASAKGEDSSAGSHHSCLASSS